MPMCWAYVHAGNSTCQGLISQGEFLVLVSAAFFNVAAVYPIEENMYSETSVGRKQTCLPGPALPPTGTFLVMCPTLGICSYQQFSRQRSWCEALPSSVG